LNEAKMFHYLKNCDDGKRVNAEMTARLQDMLSRKRKP